MTQQSPSRQSQPRRTRWQEYVISRANYLDNERSRLCQQACQDSAVTAYVEAAMTGHLAAARRAAGVEGDGRTPIQLARRDRLANAWTGASVEGAFVNLHAAEVVLVNVATPRTSTRGSPDVLSRMQTCMATSDKRRITAETLFEEQADADGRDALARRRAGLRDAMRELAHGDSLGHQQGEHRRGRRVAITPR